MSTALLCASTRYTNDVVSSNDIIITGVIIVNHIQFILCAAWHNAMSRFLLQFRLSYMLERNIAIGGVSVCPSVTRGWYC